jgi:protein-disulfide isomerase
MRPVLPSLLVTVVLLAACGGSSSSPTAPTPGSSYVISSADLSEMLSEKVMGNAAATVSIIEYSSLTCPHCADFHQATLPQIRAAYVDAGRVRFVYRDFPLDTTAVSAAMVARCSGEGFFST